MRSVLVVASRRQVGFSQSLSFDVAFVCSTLTLSLREQQLFQHVFIKASDVMQGSIVPVLGLCAFFESYA